MAPASHDVGQRRGFVSWIEKRLPLLEFIESQLTHYYAPKNFNAWYYFGVLALVVLVSQFATGIAWNPGARMTDDVERRLRVVDSHELAARPRGFRRRLFETAL